MKAHTTRRSRSRPRLELLEDRTTPAVFTVTNTDDDGGGSLRQAITDANNNATVGNFVGVNPSGSAAVPNENAGVFVLTADGTRVGGPDPADRNVISGNGVRGLFANAPDVVIQGNYIGTNAAGTSAVPNFF